MSGDVKVVYDGSVDDLGDAWAGNLQYTCTNSMVEAIDAHQPDHYNIWLSVIDRP